MVRTIKTPPTFLQIKLSEKVEKFVKKHLTTFID